MGFIADLFVKIGADSSGLKKGLSEGKKELTGFGAQLNNTVKNLTGFSLTSLGVAGAVWKVGKAIADTVNETQNYNLSMIDMARKMGTSTEEASKLAQVADDVRLSTEQLSTAMNFAIRNGIQPSIDGIANLADKYNALQDPVEKGQLLLKTFGRSGMEMGKLLEQGGDGIRMMASSIGKGLIVTENAAAASKKYYENVDKLNDSWLAFKMTVGNGIIPILNDLIDGEGDITTQLQNQKTSLETGAGLWSNYGKSAGQVADELARVKLELNWTAEAARWQGQADEWIKKQGDIAAAADQASGSILEETIALGDLSKQQIFNAVSANLSGDAALDLALAMGLVTEDAITARKVLAELDQMQDDGRLSAKDYADAVLNLSNQIDSLKSKSIDVIVNIITNGKMPSMGGQGGVTIMGGTTTGGGGGGGSNQAPSVFWGGGKASGASYVVPPGFENDTWPVAPGAYAKSGERVDIEPRGRPDSGNAELTALIRSMPNMIAVAVRDQLSRLM